MRTDLSFAVFMMIYFTLGFCEKMTREKLQRMVMALLEAYRVYLSNKYKMNLYYAVIKKVIEGYMSKVDEQCGL